VRAVVILEAEIWHGIAEIYIIKIQESDAHVPRVITYSIGNIAYVSRSN